MTTLNASDARIPPDAMNRVAYQGERVRVVRRGGPTVVLVSQDDLSLLEACEDLIDLQEARRVLAEMKAGNEKPIPLEDVKAKLGL